MRSFYGSIGLLLLALTVAFPVSASAQETPDCALLDVELRRLASPQPESLCQQHAGKVVLVVNTASFCGFTSQYRGLEKLYSDYRDRGLVVLGFPSNDFAQEPGSEQDIKQFCELTYGVGFPMYEKIAVSGGDRAHPLYRRLSAASGEEPRWNFHKYLIDRSGKRVISFPTRVEPDDADFLAALEALL